MGACRPHGVFDSRKLFADLQRDLSKLHGRYKPEKIRNCGGIEKKRLRVRVICKTRTDEALVAVDFHGVPLRSTLLVVPAFVLEDDDE